MFLAVIPILGTLGFAQNELHFTYVDVVDVNPEKRSETPLFVFNHDGIVEMFARKPSGASVAFCRASRTPQKKRLTVCDLDALQDAMHDTALETHGELFQSLRPYLSCQSL